MDQQIVSETISEDDLGFEADIQRTPYSVRSWLRYIEHKQIYVEKVPDSHVFVLYERAVKTLPGSFKLWKNYIEWSKIRLLNLDGAHREKEILRMLGVFKRGLQTLHKMPRLWIEYLAHLLNHVSHRVGLIRETFDAAIQSLPVQQHSRIWEHYLPWADEIGGEIAAYVYQRYIKIDLTKLPKLIAVLIEMEEYDTAAKQLKKAIDVHLDNGYSTYELFDQLCDLAVEHPESITSVKVEEILRASLLRHPLNSAKFWISLARYWISKGRLEKARSIFDEALRTVLTLRDFCQIFETFVEYEEKVVTEHMNLIEELKTQGIEEEVLKCTFNVDIRLARLERLIDDRAFLVNDVMLRQNPNNVLEWLKRAELFKNQKEVEQVFRLGALKINAKETLGNYDVFWFAFVKLYEDQNELESCISVFEQAVLIDFKTVKELSNVWIEYAEFYIRQNQIDNAFEVLTRATAIPTDLKVDYHDKKISVQRRLFKSLPLWSYFVDLEEQKGSFHSIRAIYESILMLKIATPQILINYALFLESNDKLEDSFKVYEKGIHLFKWPIAYEVWNIYLAKFIQQVTESNIERARDLFEMALEKCPDKLCKSLFLVYAKIEEDHGLARRAMRIYERAAKSVLISDRHEIYLYYISRVTKFFGLEAAREVFERGISFCPDKQAAKLGLQFANLELKLGEIERARAVYAHCSQFCDPRVEPEYYETWYEFEVKNGNEDTFKEMLRIKRSIQAQYNTELNFINAQVAAARKTNE